MKCERRLDWEKLAFWAGCAPLDPLVKIIIFRCSGHQRHTVYAFICLRFLANSLGWPIRAYKMLQTLHCLSVTSFKQITTLTTAKSRNPELISQHSFCVGHYLWPNSFFELQWYNLNHIYDRGYFIGRYTIGEIYVIFIKAVNTEKQEFVSSKQQFAKITQKQTV